MNESDIAGALSTQLLALPDVPYVVFENMDKPEDVARPYLRFELNPGSSPARISGGKVQQGFAQVMVVADLATGPVPAGVLADSIADLFPYEASFTASSGKVVITKDTIPGPGFRSGSDWIKIVQLDYVAI